MSGITCCCSLPLSACKTCQALHPELYAGISFPYSFRADSPINSSQNEAIRMNKDIMLSYLRNPYGIDENELRTARLQAANELERLYKIEKGLKDLVTKIENHNNDLNMELI